MLTLGYIDRFGSINFKTQYLVVIIDTPSDEKLFVISWEICSAALKLEIDLKNAPGHKQAINVDHELNGIVYTLAMQCVLYGIVYVPLHYVL